MTRWMIHEQLNSVFGGFYVENPGSFGTAICFADGVLCGAVYLRRGESVLFFDYNLRNVCLSSLYSADDRLGNPFGIEKLCGLYTEMVPDKAMGKEVI